MRIGYGWMGALALPTLLLTMAGCATTKTSIDGERDPGLEGKAYSTVLVAAVNFPDNSEAALEQEICKRIPVKCMRAVDDLPVTSRLNTTQIRSILSRDGIQSVLVVTLIGDSTRVMLVGDDTDDIANGFGLSPMVGNAAEGSAKAPTGLKQSAGGGRIVTISVRLKDAENMRNAYSGAATVTGKGVLYTKDGSFLDSSSRTIAEELVARGYFAKAPEGASASAAP